MNLSSDQRDELRAVLRQRHGLLFFVTAGGAQVSVSLQAVTFDLSIGTVDPFNLSLGRLAC